MATDPYPPAGSSPLSPLTSPNAPSSLRLSSLGSPWMSSQVSPNSNGQYRSSHANACSARSSRHNLVLSGALSGGLFLPTEAFILATPLPASLSSHPAPNVSSGKMELLEEVHTYSSTQVKKEGRVVTYETTKILTRTVVKTKRVEYGPTSGDATGVAEPTTPSRHTVPSACGDSVFVAPSPIPSATHAEAGRVSSAIRATEPRTPSRRAASVAHSSLICKAMPLSPSAAAARVTEPVTPAQRIAPFTRVNSTIEPISPMRLYPQTPNNSPSQPVTPSPASRRLDAGLDFVPATPKTPIQPSLLQPTARTQVFKAPRPGQYNSAPRNFWGEEWYADRYYVKPSDGISPPKYYLLPHPSSLKRPVLPLSGKRKYYIVTRGQAIGIFGSWTETGILVDGVSHGLHDSSKDWAQALQYYTGVYFQNKLAILPFSGSEFDCPVKLAD